MVSSSDCLMLTEETLAGRQTGRVVALLTGSDMWLHQPVANTIYRSTRHYHSTLALGYRGMRYCGIVLWSVLYNWDIMYKEK